MKKLIILCALVVISMGAFSQVRLKTIKSVDSLKLIIGGNTEHVFTEGKHATDTNEVDVIIYGGSEVSTVFAPISKGVTNGDSHDHTGGAGAQIDHTTLSNKGTKTHTEIDSHLNSDYSTEVRHVTRRQSAIGDPPTKAQILSLCQVFDKLYIVRDTNTDKHYLMFTFDYNGSKAYCIQVPEITL